MAPQTPSAPTRIIRRAEVEDRIGSSKTGIYNKLDRESPSYDPTFPKQVSIGPRAVGWVEAEIEEWVRSRIAESRNVPKQGTRPKSRGTARRAPRESSSGVTSDTPAAPQLPVQVSAPHSDLTPSKPAGGAA